MARRERRGGAGTEEGPLSERSRRKLGADPRKLAPFRVYFLQHIPPTTVVSSCTDARMHSRNIPTWNGGFINPLLFISDHSERFHRRPELCRSSLECPGVECVCVRLFPGEPGNVPACGGTPANLERPSSNFSNGRISPSIEPLRVTINGKTSPISVSGPLMFSCFLPALINWNKLVKHTHNNSEHAPTFTNKNKQRPGELNPTGNERWKSDSREQGRRAGGYDWE